MFMPKNINSITINITLEGIEKIKTEKKDINTSAVRKRQQTLKWLLDFDWLRKTKANTKEIKETFCSARLEGCFPSAPMLQ